MIAKTVYSEHRSNNQRGGGSYVLLHGGKSRGTQSGPGLAPGHEPRVWLVALIHKKSIGLTDQPSNRFTVIPFTHSLPTSSGEVTYGGKKQ